MTAPRSNTRHAVSETSLTKDQSEQMMNNDFDDRLGIAIGSGCIYVVAFDKKRCKPILLSNKDGRTKTPLTIAFVGDEHMIGEAAQAQHHPNAANTFRDLDKLLGKNVQSKVVKNYTKNEKHVIVQQNSRCLLHIPSCNK
jgi:molecular chaperone DnaK (HSP70)